MMQRYVSVYFFAWKIPKKTFAGINLVKADFQCFCGVNDGNQIGNDSILIWFLFWNVYLANPEQASPFNLMLVLGVLNFN